MTEEAEAPGPSTPEEWATYIANLPADQLWERANAANNAPFVRDLLQDGYQAKDIEQIFVHLARRLKAEGQHPPMDGYYNLLELGDWLP